MSRYSDEDGERGSERSEPDPELLYLRQLPEARELSLIARKTIWIIMSGHGGRGAQSRLGAARIQLELLGEMEPKEVVTNAERTVIVQGGVESLRNALKRKQPVPVADPAFLRETRQ